MTEISKSRIDQLRAALSAGLIDQDTFDAANLAFSAQLTGNGAIAQGENASAIGTGGVGIGRDNLGIINLGLLIQQAANPGASKDDLRRAYLARILKQTNQLPLFASDKANAPVQLSSVYTALLTQRSEPETESAQLMVRSPDKNAKRLSALDVLNTEKKLVLLGGPGSGKSTFVSFVSLSMAGELLGDSTLNLALLTAPLPKEDDSDEEPKPQRWDKGALLPVLVTLRDFASQLPPAGTPVNAETLCAYLQKQLEDAALKDFFPFLKEEMLQGRALILFDGLDEVPDANERRVQIKQAVQDLVATFSKCRFLVTSRTYAYQRQDWKLDAFAEVHLFPFTKGQIFRFITAWYEHMVELMRLSKATAKDRAEVLQRTVERNERIRELAERPLLLTLIAQLQTDKGGVLPEKREELYDKAVEMLLNQWDEMKVITRKDGTRIVEPSLAEWLNASRDNIRKQLNRLAFEAHRDQMQLAETADIRQSDLISVLLNASERREEVKVGLLEKYLRDRAGILASHGDKMYQFPHRSFQEYLAACHLTNDEFPEKLANLLRNDPNRWREVTLLAAAKAARGGELGVWALCESLCLKPHSEADAITDHWGALLAGRVLVECADLSQVAPRNEPKRDVVRAWQEAILRQNTLPAAERALAGRTLAVLGDTRPEVLTLEAMQFCFVPAGEFIMGDGNESHSVDLKTTYFIARFPVTVAQWREYLQHSDQLSQQEESTEARGNDPVVNVNWHDALAFCAYLTKAWQDKLPPGYIVTLPSEAEWEKAARGGTLILSETAYATLPDLEPGPTITMMKNPAPERVYPWGDEFDDDKTNIGSSIGETSAVGCYPSGCSPYGCEEMSGNVWEWTRSLWGKDFWHAEFTYPYDFNDGREIMKTDDEVYRVVRGGSWYFDQNFARCASRYRLVPDHRYLGLGFRLVLRFPPVKKL